MNDDYISGEEKEKWAELNRESDQRDAAKLFGNNYKEPPSTENIEDLFNIKSNNYIQPAAEPSQVPQYQFVGTQPNTTQVPLSDKNIFSGQQHFYGPTGSHIPNPVLLANTTFPALDDGSRESQKPYPVGSFPPVISAVIKGISADIDIPPEIIGNVILGASAMACQPLFEVENPGGAPETCSLYNITIADSGLGKSFVFERIMPPFLKFNDEMADVQEQLESEYKSRHKLWEREKKVLGKEFDKLIMDKSAKKEITNIILEHDKEEPKSPKKIDLFYNNTTEKTLAIDLSKAFNLAINTEEGHSFFKGYIKDSFDMFNELWDKSSYKKSRAIDVTKSATIKINTSFSMSILVQPNIFDTYCERYGKDAYEVGFFPRCFFVKAELKKSVDQVVKLSDSTAQAIENLHQRFEILLSKQKEIYSKFHQIDIDDKTPEIPYRKKMFVITEKIKSILEISDFELKKDAEDGAKWQHIKNIVYKSREKILRVAGILQCIDECNNELNEMEIKENSIRRSANIVEWYLDEASRIFALGHNENKSESDHVYLWNLLRKLPSSCRVKGQQSNYLLKNRILKHSKFSGQSPRMNSALAILVQSKLVFEGTVGRAAVLIIPEHLLNTIIK